MSVQGQNALILAALAMSYSRHGDKRFGLVATGRPEAAIEPVRGSRSPSRAFVGYDARNPPRRCGSLPQRALKVRPARSFRRLRNAGPISAPGVQLPPSPCTSRTRQRALSAIILLVEP